MSRKLKYLTKMSLDKKIKSKWFYITNIILLIIIVAIANIDSIIKLFGGDFDEKTNIIILDNTNYVYNEFEQTYDNNAKIIETLVDVDITKSDEELDTLKENIKEKDVILVIDEDKENFIKASLIVKNNVDTIVYQLISNTLNQIKTNVALNSYGVDKEKLLLIERNVDIDKISLEDDNADNNDIFLSLIFPIFMLPTFMLIIFLVQMIGSEINEEKTTKSMEIIISNVSPTTHFTSKLLSSNIFVFFQGLLLMLYAVIGIIIRFFSVGKVMVSDNSSVNQILEIISSYDLVNKVSSVLPIVVILIILTFIAYSLFAGILASMTTNMEDYQQLQTPIMLISISGYYLSMMSSMFDGSLFIRIMSYIPFISCLLSPALYIVGQIGIIDVIISILLLGGVIFILYRYGLRIYKVGILNYSSNNLWKKMFKAMKNE